MRHQAASQMREQLIAFHRHPVEETFLPLYESTRNLVYTLCYRILRDEEDAGDAFQSTYCRLLAAARAGNDEAAARDRGESVYRLAVREAQNLRNRRTRRVRKEATMEPRFLPDSQRPTDELAASRQLRERVETLVSTLPDRYRLPVLLHYLHGLSYAEIAGILDRPVGTISSRIERALKKLGPIMRRAGLAESVGVLTAIAAGSQLLSPPRSLRGADVFASADAALTSGVATTAAATVGSSLATTLLGTLLGAGIMKAKTAVIGGVIAIVAIGLIRFAVLEPERELPAPVGVSTTPADSVASLAPEPESPETPVARVLSVGGAPEPGLAAAPPTGPVLTGVVRDLATGEPIVGAEVRANSRRAAATDKTGTYVLKGLIGRVSSPGGITLNVSASGYVLEAVKIDPSGESDMIRNFTLEPGAEVLVRVIDTDGRTLEGARIGMMLGFSYYKMDYETGASGTVLVGGISRTKPRELFAEKEAYTRKLTAKPLFGADQAPPEVTLVLEAFRPEVRYYTGLITNSSGEPLAGIKVLATYADKTNFGRRTSVKTDGEGRYLLPLENPKFEFDIFAGGGGFAPQHRPDLRPGTEEEPTEVDFILEPGHWTEGVVVNQTGEPLRDVTVHVSGVGVGSKQILLFEESSSSTTDDDGRFRAEGAPDGFVTIHVEAEGFTSFRQEFEVDQEVRIVLEPGGVIRGRVVDKSTGKPVPDFTVKKAREEYHLMRRTGEAIHSAEGRFVIGDLDYGKNYLVRVEAAHFLPALVEGAVAVSRDEAEEILVELDRGQPLTGRVIEAASGGPLAGAPVIYAFVSDDSSFYWGGIDDAGFDHMLNDVQRAKTEPDGSFEFLEGERRGSLLVTAPGYLPMRIDPNDRAGVSSGGTLIIPLTRAGSISGVFYFRGAPRAGARISTWDGRVGYGPVTTDAEGSYRLAGMPVGVHKVEASDHPDSLTRRIELTGREEKRINLGDDLGPLSIEGRTLRSDGRPVDGAVITVRPKFDWDYVEFQTGTDSGGGYRIEGLAPGRYEVRAWARLDGESRDVYRTLEIQGNLEEDFIFAPKHRVTARIVFPSGTPEEMISRLSGAYVLSVTDATDHQGLRDRSIDTYVSSTVRDGLLSFTGRFAGDYRLKIKFNGDGVESSLEFPQSITLDNLDADQDLGALMMPSASWLELSLDYDPRAGRLPEYAYLYLFPRDAPRTQENSTAIGLRPPVKNQKLGPIAPGTYECALTVWGFRCEPAWTQITVSPGAASSLDINLIPEGMLYSVIQIGESKVPLKRVTLTSPRGSRVLVPDSAAKTVGFFGMLGVYKDWTDGLHVAFHDLPRGTYELTVEVEGYQIWRGTRTVIPGEGKREDISPDRR